MKYWRSGVLLVFCMSVMAFFAATAYQLGWQDGWIAYAIDGAVISNFHHAADRLPEDDDEVALQAIWQAMIADGKRQEAEWKHLGILGRLHYPLRPFWKADKGLPRRLSRSAQERIKKALENLSGSQQGT